MAITKVFIINLTPKNTENIICWISLVSLVIKDDVLNSSKSSKPNSWILPNEIFLKFAPKPEDVADACLVASIPVYMHKSETKIISPPKITVIFISFLLTALSIIRAIIVGTISSKIVSIVVANIEIFAFFL